MKHADLKTISINDLAALISHKFAEHDMKAILVGGACVAIYSNNQYLSYDLDFVTFEHKNVIKKALSELGFELKGKHFAHPDCPYFVEFVSPPVSIGEEIITAFETLSTPFGQVKLLTPTDCVKDRLASFFHWQDMQALEQAILVIQDQKTDLQEIEHWAQKEGYHDKFNEFIKAVEKAKE